MYLVDCWCSPQQKVLIQHYDLQVGGFLDYFSGRSADIGFIAPTNAAFKKFYRHHKISEDEFLSNKKMIAKVGGLKQCLSDAIVRNICKTDNRLGDTSWCSILCKSIITVQDQHWRYGTTVTSLVEGVEHT